MLQAVALLDPRDKSDVTRRFRRRVLAVRPCNTVRNLSIAGRAGKEGPVAAWQLAELSRGCQLQLPGSARVVRAQPSSCC